MEEQSPPRAPVDPTWDQLAGDLFNTGRTNGDQLINLVKHETNELPPEDRQNVIGVPGVLPVETVDEDAGTDGENDSRPTVRTESEVIEGTGAFFKSFDKTNLSSRIATECF